MSEETIPQMREQIDNLTKSNKDLVQSAEKLAKDNRTLLARDVAREQGYAASRGDLFAAQNPDADITAEALDAFVQKFGLEAASQEGDGQDGQDDSSDGGDSSSGSEDGSSNLAGMSRSGSRPGDSAGGATQELMSRQEWQVLHANDPVAAREAVRQGRVAIARDNPWSDPKPVARGTNPYSPVASE